HAPAVSVSSGTQVEPVRHVRSAVFPLFQLDPARRRGSRHVRLLGRPDRPRPRVQEAAAARARDLSAVAFTPRAGWTASSTDGVATMPTARAPQRRSAWWPAPA